MRKFKKGDMVMYKSEKYRYVGALYVHDIHGEVYSHLYSTTSNLLGAYRTRDITPCSLKYYYSTLNPSLLSRILPSKKNIKLVFSLLTLPIITLFLYISILLKGSTWARGVHHLTWGGGSKKGGGLTNVS
jgi:hypothetical protein